MAYCRVLVDGTPFVNEEGFTYELPAYLESYVWIGSLVYVPFGPKNAIKKGFVVAFELNDDEWRNNKKIKQIIMVHHLEPIILPNMLALCRYIADYYACAGIYTLKQAIPKYVYHHPLVAFEDTDTGESQVLQLKNLVHAAQCVAVGKWKMVIHRPERIQEEKFYKLASDDDRFFYESMETLKRAPKQRDVLQYIREHPSVSRQNMKDMVSTFTVVDALIKKGYIIETSSSCDISADSCGVDTLVMNRQQEKIYFDLLQQIEAGTYQKNLLNGVTGSGKTLIYEKLAEVVCQKKRQVLILVPEIALSMHLFSRLEHRFGKRIALLHSQLTERERYVVWQQVKTRQVDIVLGPRSALFLPFSDLGLIVIDEEHESSYKQSEPDPRYEAITVAEYLGQEHGAVLLLGSATPSVETLYEVVEKKCQIFNLPERANHAALPAVHLVDMREERKSGYRGLFSRALQMAMSSALARREQVILLINRKGYSSSVSCHECGEVMRCPRCDIPLTYYQSTNELKCNYCEFHMPMIQCCPVCGSDFIETAGTGTERVEESCQHLFPHATLARLDAESMANTSSREHILREYERGGIDILVGTQLLAKGLDFNNTTCIGVIGADLTLNLPDFRSAERCFQLMVQVAGRAGRDNKPSHVYIQTYQPEHYAFRDAVTQNIHQFFLDEIAFRRQWLYPPFVHLCRIIVSDYQINDVEVSMQAIYNYIVGQSVEMEVMGPSFAPLSKKNNRYRMHLIIKARCTADLQWLMKQLRMALKSFRLKQTTRVLIDINPENIL